MRGAPAVCLAVLASLPSGSAWAGPPFLTDDPEPVDVGHREAYLFATADTSDPGTSGQLPALEVNWGAAPELQLHLVAPVAFSDPSPGPRASGFGDVVLGAKLRLLDETDSAPQVGIFPMVSLPTGSASRGLGNGAATVTLPVWVQKSFGPWTTYGGGGYTFNRATDGTDYPFGGWLLQRQLTPGLAIAGEVFALGRTSPTAPGTAIVNVGGQWELAHGLSLLGSVGHSVAGARHTVAYLGLYTTWGPS
jgi:hypothetical protein